MNKGTKNRGLIWTDGITPRESLRRRSEEKRFTPDLPGPTESTREKRHKVIPRVKFVKFVTGFI